MTCIISSRRAKAASGALFLSDVCGRLGGSHGSPKFAEPHLTLALRAAPEEVLSRNASKRLAETGYPYPMKAGTGQARPGGGAIVTPFDTCLGSELRAAGNGAHNTIGDGEDVF